MHQSVESQSTKLYFMNSNHKWKQKEKKVETTEKSNNKKLHTWHTRQIHKQ